MYVYVYVYCTTVSEALETAFLPPSFLSSLLSVLPPLHDPERVEQAVYRAPICCTHLANSVNVEESMGYTHREHSIERERERRKEGRSARTKPQKQGSHWTEPGWS